MSYVIIGDKVYSSDDIFKGIKKEFEFKEIKDLTAGSKRDDTFVFQITLDAKSIKLEILEEMDAENMEEDELVEELLSSSDEQVMMIEDVIPEGFIGYAYTYKYDNDMELLKSIFVAVDEKLGESKLREIAGRILKSLD